MIALRATAALAAAALAVSCAEVEPPLHKVDHAGGPRQCFFLSQVNGYTHAGRDRIVVSTGPSERYLFKTLGPCNDLDNAEGIGFDPAGGGSICSGIDVDLIVPSTIGPQRCPVGMIRQLAPGERVRR